MRTASQPCVYVVIVLYNQPPEKSASLGALLQELESDPRLASAFRVLIYDNSPVTQADLLTSASLLYHHDASNQGLAAAYNHALAAAAADDCSWLLLLDQDTVVTRSYLDEALSLTESLRSQPRVGAIVPKLESEKGIKSPTLDFLDWLRRQVQLFSRRPLFAHRELQGLQEDQYSAFNSAAILRVSALQHIGGFPREFWLDFLDVAVFHALHTAGFRMYVMRTALEHELSMDTRRFYEQRSALARHQNLLSAMVRFVRTRGTPRDLRLTRLWLLRNAFDLLRSAHDKRFSLASLKQAILLRHD